MAEQIILENEYATIRYITDHKYVYHTFHKPIGGQPFRDILDAGLDALKANNANKWLSDDRNNSEFEPEDAQFAIADWEPRAANAGWKYWALVVPESVAGRAGMVDIVNTFGDLGVKLSLFTDLEKAREWITSV